MCLFRVICLLTWYMITETLVSAFAARLGREFEEFQSRRQVHEIWTEDSISTDQQNPAPENVQPTRQPESIDAKLLWNHFMFRRKSEFQAIMSIRNNEVHQEKCRTLSFTQRVSHENCETQVLKNNVCFGKCQSTRAQADAVSCYVCSPTKSSRKTVQLKCKDHTTVTKTVTVVEDCGCQIKKGWHPRHHSGPVLVDPSIGLQQPRIPY